MSFILFIFILITLSGCASPLLKQTKKEDYVLMNNYAVRCVENSLWEEARIWLERAKALNPDCANVYNNLGVVYEHFKLTESAKEAYKKAIELNPKEKIYKQNLELLEEFLRKKEKNEEEKR